MKSQIWDLRSSNAPPLAGSLPFSVRTFLSRSPIKCRSSDRPTCPCMALAS